MPRIFDNIDLKLEKALKESLEVAYRCDFCVGFFNLRGWHLIQESIDKLEGGEEKNCRLLIGMQKTPFELLKQCYALHKNELLDREIVKNYKNQVIKDFKDQLTVGIPSELQEFSLKKLLKQLKEEKVQVKLAVENLHAKLYLAYRKDNINPTIPYLGSSNLTVAGLSRQGELNVDVLDSDAATKLSKWFEDRWNDKWCIDITKELIDVISNSWYREEQIPPYYIYLKMAYHLAQEAREGLAEFTVPKIFRDILLDFQEKAVLVAANHLNKRRGVIIGDVVGLGKTMIASALAKVFEHDYDTSCLILCPPHLQSMWRKYVDDFDLRARILSISKVQTELKELKRYRLVLIDESHNLRNKDGKRYNAIKDYIQRNDSKVILLTATPYNKSFQDISTQLRFFIGDDEELIVKPERFIKEMGEDKFRSDFQISPKSILAFEKSEYAEDWQDLLRYYMVRRTRSFIKDNYAKLDEERNRYYLEFSDGRRSYFTDRIAKSIKFNVDTSNKNDQYARLYSEKVVEAINHLYVPRYGLANYLINKEELSKIQLSDNEQTIIRNLSRAGKQLMGFCRTNLFKRLESSGYSFLLSLKRHILRNYIFIYAINNNLPLPIGSQNPQYFDVDSSINDIDNELQLNLDEDNPEEGEIDESTLKEECDISADLMNKAECIYKLYQTDYKNRFKWINSGYFKTNLKKKLSADNETLETILKNAGEWHSTEDKKLKELENLIKTVHPNDKILVFTQFADTAEYLLKELKESGITNIECATGNSEDPTALAYKFSPESNKVKASEGEQTRVLIATDVLSEGQNLQDSFIIVNFDLPWAIIKLIQRAGRVDRIGQKSEQILCYTFIPADGVEKIIALRRRLKTRLKQNAEVVGTDEQFFEDEEKIILKDLYNEKAGVLDEPEDNDVDLASYAYQIWKNALDINPKLKEVIANLPDVIYSTKESKDKGVLVYTKTGYGNDILSYIGHNGEVISQSQFKILKMAECSMNEPPVEKINNHHELVRIGVENILKEEKLIGGQLGKKSGARYRVYQRLESYAKDVKGKLFDTPELHRIIDEIYKYPLTDKAKEVLNRQLKTGVNDYGLYELVNSLRGDGKLCITTEEVAEKQPRIICSLGLNRENKGV